MAGSGYQNICHRLPFFPGSLHFASFTSEVHADLAIERAGPSSAIVALASMPLGLITLNCCNWNSLEDKHIFAKWCNELGYLYSSSISTQFGSNKPVVFSERLVLQDLNPLVNGDLSGDLSGELHPLAAKETTCWAGHRGHRRRGGRRQRRWRG